MSFNKNKEKKKQEYIGKVSPLRKKKKSNRNEIYCHIATYRLLTSSIYMRLSIIRFFSLLSSKITQPHLPMNNMFPPINTHSRPPSEDLHGVSSGGIATDIHSPSKHQQIRRNQQTIDQQRRSPLRSNSLLTTPTAKQL